LGGRRPVGVAFHAVEPITGTNQVKDIRDIRTVMKTQHQYSCLVIKRVRFLRNIEINTLGPGLGMETQICTKFDQI